MYFTKGEVMELTGYSRTTIWERDNEEAFGKKKWWNGIRVYPKVAVEAYLKTSVRTAPA